LSRSGGMVMGHTSQQPQPEDLTLTFLEALLTQRLAKRPAAAAICFSVLFIEVVGLNRQR